MQRWIKKSSNRSSVYGSLWQLPNHLTMPSVAQQLIHWHKHHGRHHLPWQKNRNPYAIWLSEVMLQQTQVNTVIPYYERFMQEFPTIRSLAHAPLDSVLALWSGLGYYSRARNLHQAARILVRDYEGQFPNTREAIQQFPGIGRSTAAAIAVFAFHQREAILDGNVKRILARYFGIRGYPGDTLIQNQLWQKAEELLPGDDCSGDIETYTQALMDLGATVCTRRKPACNLCPLEQACIARVENTTDRLPTPKKSKPLPQKEVVFLILLQQQKLLLQKRPPRGIWGALWCLPEVETGTNAINYCHHQWGIRIHSSHWLPALDHQFTHFKLRIHPQVLHVVSGTLNECNHFIWIDPIDALEQAIPVPVRTLLRQNLLSNNEFRSSELTL